MLPTPARLVVGSLDYVCGTIQGSCSIGHSLVFLTGDDEECPVAEGCTVCIPWCPVGRLSACHRRNYLVGECSEPGRECRHLARLTRSGRMYRTCPLRYPPSDWRSRTVTQ